MGSPSGEAMHGAEPSQSREGPHEVLRLLGGGEGCLLSKWKLPQLPKQHLQDVINRITINVYRMSGQPASQCFLLFWRKLHIFFFQWTRKEQTQPFEVLWKECCPFVFIGILTQHSCFLKENKSSSAVWKACSCPREEVLDPRRAARTIPRVIEASTPKMQCFLMGTQSNFLLAVQGSPSVG